MVSSCLSSKQHNGNYVAFDKTNITDILKDIKGTSIIRFDNNHR